VDGEGIQPDPEKVQAIYNLKPLTDVRAVRRFLGIMGYFCHCIPDYSAGTQLLRQLIRKDTTWEWGDAVHAEWEYLRGCLAREPVVLKLPHDHWDWVLDTDAADTAIAGVGPNATGRERNHPSRGSLYCSLLHHVVAWLRRRRNRCYTLISFVGGCVVADGGFKRSK